VLKKAAVAVVITAAGLLAVSPLAFAGNDHSGHGNKAVEKSEGLVNVADNNVNTPIQACNNDVPINGGAAPVQVPVKDITGAATGALGILGSARATTDQTVDNSRSCGDNTASGDSVKQHG
jgi:hypothetical protein